MGWGTASPPACLPAGLGWAGLLALSSQAGRLTSTCVPAVLWASTGRHVLASTVLSTPLEPTCRLPASCCTCLHRYAQESKAVFKIAGYWQAQQARAAAAAADGGAGQLPADGAATYEAAGSEGSTCALHALVGFLRALTNDDADGRVILSTQQQQQQPPEQQGQQVGCRPQVPAASGSAQRARAGLRPGPALHQQQHQEEQQPQGMLKYVLLNAAAHFARVASAAHAVVLASGTLSPVESVLHLFPGTPSDQVHHFSCGHVVGQDRWGM